MKVIQLKDLEIINKRVLLRFDGDVPVEKRKISDDFRLKGVIQTIKHCLDHKARVVLLAHRGRPEGKIVPDLSNQILADYFSKLFKDWINPKTFFWSPLEKLQAAS